MENPFARTGRGVLEVAPGSRGPGDINLLVAVKGEPSHVAALDGFTKSIGPDLGAVALVRPATTQAGARKQAEADLASAALFVSAVRPRLLITSDPSARGLHKLVRRERALLVVVLDDPACAEALRKLTAHSAVRVIGTSILTPRRRPRR
jgi:hypothetical protein